MQQQLMDEKIYRKILDDTYARIDRAFEDVDPDLAEVTVAQGALTVVFDQKMKLMLTPQPSVRQLWVAFRDRAWHFDWDPGQRAWMDDRGLGIELGKLVEDTTRDAAGVNLRIATNR
jgi:iron donor protein CyaY